ncbi:isopeptide-forming domain-containing fimbrial protein [Microbacterium sp. NPDC089695]|uniref:isopeptide-forming domain-containing fimbrial protein n=1 Tax=Microbacterium sp. NPDC089695 TaxID=3364198 RepID=UPI0037FD9AD2
MRSTLRRKFDQRARRLTAVTAVVSLIAGALALGVTAQTAVAAPWAPSVTAQSADPSGAGKDFVLAGEDVTFDVAVRNGDGGAQFNLSLVAMLPASVEYVSGGAFGAPVVYAEGETLPNRSRTVATGCEALGLVAAAETPLCAVPAGQQVWVWSNVNDLPQGATVSSSIVIAPVSDLYPVGGEIGFSIRAYTSNDPSRLPTYDGSPSVARTTAHTSGAGTATDDVPVQALRIVKNEPSVESELLRGVHSSVTTYTLRVENTTRGATTGVTVTDYLPAGLEYLGLAAGDNSTGIEYPGAPALTGGVTAAESVDTVRVDAARAAALGLPGAGVYTVVVWTLGELAAGATAEIRYHAAVPLFANELWAEGSAPAAAAGGQAANLDNNTGASTRHGGADSAEAAQSFRNVAAVAGTYQGAVLGGDPAHRAAHDDDDEVIEAVDVRVVKGVESGGMFDTGAVATYSVRVDVSEYVDASEIVLTDVIPNGLCPAFPASGSDVTLKIGDREVTGDEWNAQIAGDACDFPTAVRGADVSEGLTLTSMTYAPAEGTFTVTFAVADLAAGASYTGRYAAMQRPDYTGANGGTSSGDRFVNTVHVAAQTTPIAAIADDPDLSDRVGGVRHALDDSSAVIASRYTGLEKTVLERGQAPTDTDAVWSAESATPFSPGDDVWYRIVVPFAAGIDTRDPILTDYLPEGVDIAEVAYGYRGIPGVADVTGPVAWGSGTFPSEYIPNTTANGTALSWEFGARNRSGSDDRFMPAGSTVTVYLRGEVSAQSASSDDVDSPLNHAKYQQVNVDGEISFLRDDAGIDLDWGATLTKGIRAVDGDVIGAGFGSRIETRQVVQGDEVEYRIDVTAPQNTTTDYVVWDVLPAGVTKADVSGFTAERQDAGASVPLAAGEFSATAYDAGETLPDGIAPARGLTDRSVIAWTVSASVAGSAPATEAAPAVVRGVSLGYTLTVPAGVAGGGDAAQLTQSYTNTAGIVSYAIENTPSRTTTVVPQTDGGGQQLTTRTPRDGEVATGDAGTVDSAEVHLPDVVIEKKLVSTAVAPTADSSAGIVDLGDGARNSATQIVQGEYATFEYAVTIPARTTIAGAVLADDGAFGLASGSVTYQYVAGSAAYIGPDGAPLAIGDGADDFRASETAGATHGVLTFPDTYTNDTAQPQTFRVRITTWVHDRDSAAGPSVRDIANGAQLTNTARLVFRDPNAGGDARLTRTDTASVQFVEPEPTLRKTSSSATVSSRGTVTYTLTATNASGRPALYDAVVIDCVPKEITPSDLRASTGTARILDEACEGTADTAITRGSGTGTLIEWTISALRGDASTATLTYLGTVQEHPGGGSEFVNRAELAGHTLPLAVGADADTADRRGTYTRTANATVRMPEASIEKTVAPASAAVGEVVTYTVTTTLPSSTNFYDVALTDTLPVGVEYVAEGTSTQTVQWAGGPNTPTVGAPSLSGRTLSWSIAPNDVVAWNGIRTITVTYQARLTTSVAVAAPMNSATFAWSRVDGSTSDAERRSQTATAPITILNPSVTIAKAVKNAGADDTAYGSASTGGPEQSFTYRVRVTAATGVGTAPAYGVVVTDTVDPGIRIDTAQPVFADATFSDGAALREGRGGVITWTLAGPLGDRPGSEVVDLVYDGTFVPAEALGTGALGNRAVVTRYESAETGGWTYRPGTGTRPGGGAILSTNTSGAADITPRFPQVALSKRATSGSEAFVGETFSWTLQARNSGTGAAQTITLTDTLPANWEYDATVVPRLTVGTRQPVDLAAPVITAKDGRQVLTWTLGSSSGQPLLAGTSSGATDAQRTLLVTFSTVPHPGAVTDAGAGLSVDHRNTVGGSATDTTGSTRNASGAYVGADASASAHIARADLRVVKQAIGGVQGVWTAGDTARSGYAQPQWRITISNQGPDAASGPFTVTDAVDLPDGVTTGAFTARYHASASDTTGVALTLTGSGTTDDPFVVGGRARTLKADGTDRIVLLANVSVAASATGTASNTAAANGRTYERPADVTKDNASSASTVIATAADLAVTKTANTVEPTAGRPITWSIAVRNNGPSVALSTGATPITVTDTIPAGVSEVQDPSAGLSAWTVSASDGWPAAAGDIVTWTFVGSQMPVGPAQSLALTGTIDASWTGGEIRNAASVVPGATTDPTSSNNTGEAAVTPGDATTLAITKTRVVRDNGEWKDAAHLGAALPDVVAGDTVSYRVIVTNNGPADARDVRVVDEVPGMLTYASVEDESGAWTRTAGPGASDTFAVDGTVPAASGQSTRSFIVTYTVDAALVPGSEVENWAQASATNATNAPRDGDTTASDRVADLSIVKQAIGADGAPVADDVVPEVVAGTETRFLLTVTNRGPSISGAPIDISDRLPAGLDYVSSTIAVAGSGAVDADAVVSDDGRTLSWAALGGTDTLASGATIVIEVTTAVSADLRPQRLVNAADVTGPDDVDPSDNHDEASIDVVRLAEMTIVKEAAAGPWIAGTEVVYTLTVDNAGPSVADAFVADVLPSGLTPVSIAGEGWTCDDAAQTCSRSEHPLGESTITVVALIGSDVPTGTALTNTATLTWTDSRSTSPHEDEDTARIDVTTDADLRLVKTAITADGDETSTAIAGESLRYRVDVENLGSSDAVGPVTVTDRLPDGTSFLALTDDASDLWTAVVDENDAQLVTFTLAPSTTGLASGVSAPAIEFAALVDPAAAHDSILRNTATVSSGTPDAHADNDTDAADVTVAREVDLAVVKRHDADAVRIGDELPFTLQVRNVGPSEATGVVIVDTVPAGLEVVTAVGDAVGTGWTLESVEPVDGDVPEAGTRVVARYAPPLSPGDETADLVIGTRVLVGAYPEVVNVAEVTAEEITDAHPDRTPEDNRVEDAVDVPAMAALVVTKTALGLFQVGKEGTYEIVVRNIGPTADPGPITVTDALPDGLTFASSPDAGVRVDGRVVTWTLADGIPVDGEVTLTLHVRVGQATYPAVMNIVSVDSPTEQVGDAELVSNAGADVAPADPLATTGAAPAWALALLALLMLVCGGLLLVRRRRRVVAAALPRDVA